jgi:hypothetical protein
MTLFTVTYQMPGKPVITTGGHTSEGVSGLMNAILSRGGWGSVSSR